MTEIRTFFMSPFLAFPTLHPLFIKIFPTQQADIILNVLLGQILAFHFLSLHLFLLYFLVLIFGWMSIIETFLVRFDLFSATCSRLSFRWIHYSCLFLQFLPACWLSVHSCSSLTSLQHVPACYFVSSFYFLLQFLSATASHACQTRISLTVNRWSAPTAVPFVFDHADFCETHGCRESSWLCCLG